MSDVTAQSYDPKKYRTPDGLPVDIAIFTITSTPKETAYKALPIRELKILLVKRKEWPYKDQWAFPGGFSRENESLLAAAKRELREETNVSEDVHIEQFGIYYDPQVDEQGNIISRRDPRGWIPSVVYYALVHERHLQSIKAADDATDARLFNVNQALTMNLAFDHKQILQDLIRKLREKMLQTTIAREFLSEEFTIAELFQVIQTVVPDFDIPKNNFLRNVLSTKSRKGLLEKALDSSGHHKTTDRHSQRPARLYRFSDYTPPQLSIYG